ncbi:tn3 transposase DDE domain protein [Collimonas pratensis]|uniref:Tn3 transposase DDE domain protein n=1 Tax=Collimonas pratensis TaxID=279113 RepID=A0A127PY39_9BURK|nr:tn3 transposase DDE domain protein [Collimonas pratensis]
MFGICYRNTSDIAPTAIIGDMHGLNKVNFAIRHRFGPCCSSRFRRPHGGMCT